MKTIRIILPMFLALFAVTINAYAQCDDCTTLGQGQGAICNTGGAEGYAKCATYATKCTRSQTGVCYTCILYPPYEYCVYGPATLTQTQAHPPSVETMKLIPWIVDDSIPELIASYSTVPGIEKLLAHMQMLELKDGISESGFIAVYTNPETVRWVVRLSTEEIDSTRVRQYVDIFKVKNEKGVQVKTKDVIDGIIGQKVEGIVFDEDHWTWTGHSRKWVGKIAPYTGPRAQISSCAKTKPS